MPSLSIQGFLRELKTERILYCPNPGNAGDSFISLATFELFREVGIDWEIYRPGLPTENRIVVYGGGGNLNPRYDLCAKFIQHTHARAKRLILLPHTITGCDHLLSTLGNNVDVLCREPVSYEYVCTVAPQLRTHLMADLAFSLNSSAILRRELASFEDHLAPKAASGARWRKYRFRRGPSDLHRVASQLVGQTRILKCFRNDAESNGQSLPWDNIDLSKAIPHDGTAASPSACAESTFEMFRLLSRVDEIQTDRLHIAIAGALLGKQVRMYPNAYYKNKAVFEFSIYDNFPNVRWMGK